MLISGILTCTMVVGLFFPEKLLRSNFGETISGDLANVVVRNWAALITLIGVALILGAFISTIKRFVLILAGVSKSIFIVLILIYGMPYFNFGIGTAVIIDTIMVVLYTIYLLITLKVPVQMLT